MVKIGSKEFRWTWVHSIIPVILIGVNEPLQAQYLDGNWLTVTNIDFGWVLTKCSDRTRVGIEQQTKGIDIDTEQQLSFGPP